jgi:hypothetical protein
MAQLAPIATLVGTGASLYGTIRQAQQQQAGSRQQVTQAQQQANDRAAQLAAQQEQDARERAATLERTTAATRARLAAAGVSPDEGSAAAITAGLAADAAEAQADSDRVFRARLASGRRSLLQNDGSLTSFIRAGTSFGNSLRNLLE